MKSSYYVTPRTMQDCTFIESGNAFTHYPQSRTESAAGVILAIVIGVLLAAALVHWAMLP